jgi:4-oxalocrotonate tautomerase
MPIIHVEMFEGRTLEQKRALAKNLTDTTVNTLGVPVDSVTVVINEMKTSDYAKAGILRCDK